MTAREAISYIENQGWSATRLGLERTRALLDALGNPQKKLKFIHVAGSNGKGSTCAMLDSVLRAAGYRTGLYVSPYIQDFCERMQVNGGNIPGEALAKLTEEVKSLADAMEDHPSQFELVTAIAMAWFAREKCDIVVLEVGMGGALDSTNAIDAPEAAVITNIGLEHTEYLGDTIEKIAATKAGIIKRGCACVCYDGPAEATAVVEAVCREKNVPLTCVDFKAIRPLDRSLNGQRFSWREEEFSLPLLGAHQLHNAAAALETVEALRRRGWQISPEAAREGLRTVKWPARFEVLSFEPLFVLDGGHNPQCAQALADILEDYLPGKKLTFLMGVLADKDWGSMLDAVTPHAARFVCVTPDSPRALPARTLAAELARRGVPAVSCGSVGAGIRAALEAGGPAAAFGSLYMAGAIRSSFPPELKSFQRAGCLARRRALTARERAAYGSAICRRLMALPELQDAKTILSYMAAEYEADLGEFHAWAQARGKRLAFPVSHAGGRMEAAVPDGPDGWEVGKYGIRAPVRERSALVDPEELDAVLVPCAGFDSAGGRIGRGGGYYDRYLPLCPGANRILAAFEVQRVERAAAEGTDQRMDIAVTEAGTWRFDRV